ncbi:DUF4825 domain-containing protein [Heyndrickxia sporothermodurans]
MKTRNRIIVGLLMIGIAIFLVVNLLIIPQNHAKELQYAEDQKEAITHDLDSILKYQNPYLGNASNSINLFNHLPLSEYGTSFQIYSEQLAIEVKYDQSIDEIGEKKTHRSLIYNSTAAFALIGNLQEIRYRFYDTSYTVKRNKIENLYKNFEDILNKAIWESEVQKKLRDDQYVENVKVIVVKEQN